MFKVQCFVDDKRLATVLRALKGSVYNVVAVPIEQETPKKKNGRVNLSGISLKGRKTINSAEMKEILQGVGLSPGSSSYALKQLVSAGRIKKNTKAKGSNSFYEVL